MARHLDRRRFLAGTGAAAAALALPACRSSAAPRVLPRSPDDEIRVAVVGVRSRGRDHIAGFARLPHVRVVALCDVDEQILLREAARCAEQKRPVDTYRDLRVLLDRPDIDAISVATPNHWHALMAVWACQAGKDVYLEKPVSHCVWEGRQIVRAARRHGRVVQSGTQSRSSHAIRDAIAWLHQGHLGRIQWAQGLCYKPRTPIGKVGSIQPVPKHIDYDLWCGPAPMTPLQRKELHYDWHWAYATGNGDLGNQGIHQMDLCRWALGERGLPTSVRSVGGRMGYDDDGETPNTQLVVCEYPTAPLVFEVRGLPRDRSLRRDDWRSGDMDEVLGTRIAALVHCEGGTLVIPDYQSAEARDPQGKVIQQWQGADDHYQDFIDVVRSRRLQDLAADIEEGHVSSALCHLGLLSHAHGQRSDPDAIGRDFDRVPHAGARFASMRQHLERNEVDLGRDQLTLGAILHIDPQRESVLGAGGSSAMLRDQYRAPFVVPEQV